MGAATNLYLIRHGESVPNVTPIVGGMLGDAGLTPRGREQAALLEQRLRLGEILADVLYTSTLPRAVETATYVARALGMEARHDDTWHELRPGEADGIPIDEWKMRYGGDEFLTGADPFRPFSPGGESWGAFLLRVGSAIRATVARHLGQTIVVVCHGGVLEGAFYHAFGLGPTSTRVHFVPHNASITQWRYHHPETGAAPYWTLVTYNDAAHLLPVGDTAREAIPTPATEKRGS